MFVYTSIVDDEVERIEIHFGPVQTLVLAAVIFFVGVTVGAYFF